MPGLCSYRRGNTDDNPSSRQIRRSLGAMSNSGNHSRDNRRPRQPQGMKPLLERERNEMDTESRGQIQGRRGIAALEDENVQTAVVSVVNQIYEQHFRGFSYGFGRGTICQMVFVRPPS